MSNLRVGVAGATGALGKEIIGLLDRARWRPDHLTALASRSTTTPQVDYGDERVPVDDLDVETLDTLDLLVLATPPDVAARAGARALEDGVRVVDCTGSLADGDTPVVIPWVNPEALGEHPDAEALVVPTPGATLLASVLGPLRRAGLGGSAQAVVLAPASAAGRDGIDELSRQVVALFNAGTPPRKVFEHGLAFDLVPQWGGLQADEDPAGWTSLEAHIANQTAALARTDAPVVTVVGVPVFSGISAHITVDVSRTSPPDLVARILGDGGVHVEEEGRARTVPRPRRVEGRPRVEVGRIRFDPHGSLHLWASMDNLAVTAAVAVANAGLLLRDHLEATS